LIAWLVFKKAFLRPSQSVRPRASVPEHLAVSGSFRASGGTTTRDQQKAAIAALGRMQVGACLVKHVLLPSLECDGLLDAPTRLWGCDLVIVTLTRTQAMKVDEEALDAEAAAPKPEEKLKKKKEGFPSAAVKVVLPRGEKEEFASFLASKFLEASFRSSFLKAKTFAKLRGVVRGASIKKFPVKCLDHRGTFHDLVNRATRACPEGDALRRHWTNLDNAAKGSRKIVNRNLKLTDKGDFRGKHKKHQSRHY